MSEFGSNQQSGESPQRSHDRPPAVPSGRGTAPHPASPTVNARGIGPDGEPSMPDPGAFSQRATPTRSEFRGGGGRGSTGKTPPKG